jgi:hypothetical protein
MIFLRGTASLGDWSNMRIAMLGGYKTAFYRPGLDVRFGGRGLEPLTMGAKQTPCTHRTQRCFCAGAWHLALVTTYNSVLTKHRILQISGPSRDGLLLVVL